MQVKTLIPGVIKKLRGRDDLTDDIPGYVKKALLDITENIEIEELRVTGPVSAFNQGQAEYPKEGSLCPFIAEGDIKITQVVTWFVYFVSTLSANSPTGFEIKYRQPRVVEPMSKKNGQPTYYSMVGNNLIVGFNPSDNFITQMRYQKQHPFSLDPNNWINDKVYLPDSWQDVIEYAAAEKGCDDSGMDDLGMKYHQKLFGYKDKYGNELPGLIMGRQTQQQRNAGFNETQLRPVVRRYTY